MIIRFVVKLIVEVVLGALELFLGLLPDALRPGVTFVTLVPKTSALLVTFLMAVVATRWVVYVRRIKKDVTV